MHYIFCDDNTRGLVHPRGNTKRLVPSAGGCDASVMVIDDAHGAPAAPKSHLTEAAKAPTMRELLPTVLAPIFAVAARYCWLSREALDVSQWVRLAIMADSTHTNSAYVSLPAPATCEVALHFPSCVQAVSSSTRKNVVETRSLFNPKICPVLVSRRGSARPASMHPTEVRPQASPGPTVGYRRPSK
jgi:hypothetical protein